MTDLSTPTLDRMSSLLERLHVSVRLFHTGALCGTTSFDAQAGRGFLHVLRQGGMVITHHPSAGVTERLEVSEPTLLFYPQPLAHRFHHALQEGSDFTCASVHFEGGAAHPLARSLPPLIVLPLVQVPSLAAALALLFQEADAVRCGHRLIADRLFEVVVLQLLRWLLDHGEQAGASMGLIRGLSDAQLARALTAMHEQPDQRWSVDTLAAQAAMSRSAFAQRFKQVVGDTPAEYLADWRMVLAKKLLRQGRALKLMAPELGYANASALSRVFAQRVGMSPRDWLDQQREIS